MDERKFELVSKYNDEKYMQLMPQRATAGSAGYDFNTQWPSFLNLYNVFVILYKWHMMARSIFCYNMVWLFVVVPAAVYGVLGRQIRQINQLVGRFLMGVFSNTNLWYEIGTVVIIVSLIISIIIYLKNYRRTKQLYIKLNQQANDLLNKLDEIDNK